MLALFNPEDEPAELMEGSGKEERVGLRGFCWVAVATERAVTRDATLARSKSREKRRKN